MTRTARTHRFRETAWFKQGAKTTARMEVLEANGEDAEIELDDDDLVPIDERYADDGSLSPLDSARYGTHTGYTQQCAPFVSLDMDCVSDNELLATVARPLTRPLVLLGFGLFACGTLIASLVM